MLTEVLLELGYVPIEAPDAAAGLTILQSDAQIDLLIRGSCPAATADLKVLFITGYAENAIIGNGTFEPNCRFSQRR
jgi:hypothetical protein